MKNITKILVTGLALSVIIIGCKKKEEQPIPKTFSHPQTQSQLNKSKPNPISPHGNTGSKAEKKIVVPESIKSKWNKVKFVVEDKASKKSSEYTANVGSELKVPNTNLRIVVGEFLPDFRMDESTITSASDAPNNPAVRVEVFENGKSIFKGWLYSRFPTIHPFEHEKYGLTLKEGIKG